MVNVGPLVLDTSRRPTNAIGSTVWDLGLSEEMLPSWILFSE